MATARVGVSLLSNQTTVPVTPVTLTSAVPLLTLLGTDGAPVSTAASLNAAGKGRCGRGAGWCAALGAGGVGLGVWRR